MSSGERISGLATIAGRGLIINGVFEAGLQSTLIVQSLLVPRLLGPAAVGLFAIASATVSIGATFKELGIEQKLVQERQADLPLAYSVAFTLEMILSGALFLAVLALAPAIAAFYHRDSLLPIVAVLALTIFTNAFLGLPSALYTRGLNYLKQNIVDALGPVVGFAITVPMAFLGYGVWSLVGGAIGALVVSAITVAWVTPIRPRFKMNGPIARRFLAYGWPLWLTRLLGLSTTIAGTLVISKALGVAALGYFSMAQGVAQRAFRLDGLIGQTLFPILCRAPDDIEGQRRAFIASNRVTAMWSAPLGFGLAIFAPDIVHLILGPKWVPAIFLLRMQSLAIVLGSIGFSWDIFFRARGRTKPTLMWSMVNEGWVFVVLLPSVIFFGLNGAAWAIGSLGLIAIVARQIPISRLFPGLNLVAGCARELLAGGVVAAGAFFMREALGPPRSLFGFAGMLAAFGVASIAAILVVDGAYLADLLRRVRGAAAPAPGVAALAVEPDGALGAMAPAPSTTELIERAELHPVSTALRTIGVEDSLATPGGYPLYLSAAGDRSLWVTLRDSSVLAWLDLDTGEWRRWRLPLWPHAACTDDRGRAWVALTLSSQVATVDPEERRARRVRLPRTRELLLAAWDGDAAVVVDAWHRRLWRIDDSGKAAIDLPEGMRRPDYVVPDGRGSLWVSDIGTPVLARVGRDTGTLFPSPGRIRAVVVEPGGHHLWLGHFVRPLMSRLDLDDPDRGTVTMELPGTPTGMAFGPDGLLWASLFDADAVIALDRSGVQHRIDLPRGSGPTSVLWLGEHLVVACGPASRLLVVR